MLDDAMRTPKFQVLDTMDGSELRYLLSLERLGMLDGPQKDRLGLLLMNVARTAVAQMIADGKLQPRYDEDFDADMVMYAVQASRKAPLDSRTPQGVWCYIRTAVQNRIKNWIRHNHFVERVKSKNAQYNCSAGATDFYMNRRTP